MHLPLRERKLSFNSLSLTYAKAKLTYAKPLTYPNFLRWGKVAYEKGLL